MNKLVISVISVLVIVALVLMFIPFVNVDQGEMAVVTQNGALKGTFGPGLHFMTPIIDTAHVFDVRTQKEQADSGAASKDLQTVNATVAINYNVKPEAVGDLYSRIGMDYKSRVIDPAIQEAVKSATAKYTAEELITKRDLVTAEIKDSLSAALSPSDIQVTGVNIVNFAFSPDFDHAIEAKVTAVQNALAAQNDLQAAQFKAQAIEVTAKAANNDNYIHLQELEVEKAAIAKWNGTLPTQMIPGQTLPFLNLTTTK